MPVDEHIGRLALRAEGNVWNAYFATTDTMADAVLIGSIALAAIADKPERADAFIDMMGNVVADIIENKVGTRPIWGNPQAAPEHERQKPVGEAPDSLWHAQPGVDVASLDSLAAAWNVFAAICQDEGNPQWLKRAFYAGADSMLLLTMSGLSPGAEVTDDDLHKMDRLADELRAFGASVQAGKA
jgi:hypothetical protein